MHTVALTVLADELAEATEYFTDVALGEGLAPLLLLVGAIIILFSVAVFGVLTIGAVASLFRFD